MDVIGDLSLPLSKYFSLSTLNPNLKLGPTLKFVIKFLKTRPFRLYTTLFGP